MPCLPVLRLWRLAFVLPDRSHALLAHLLQRTEQQTPRFERYSIPASHDKPTDGPFPQPFGTPTLQEFRGLGKGLRQGGHDATDIRHWRLDVHLPVDPQRGGGTHEAGWVRQKHLLGLNIDIAPTPLEGIRDNPAVLEHHKLWVDGDVATHGLRTPANFCRNGTVTQPQEVRRRDLDITAIGLCRPCDDTPMGAQEAVLRSEGDVSSVPRISAFGRDGSPIGEVNAERLQGYRPSSSCSSGAGGQPTVLTT